MSSCYEPYDPVCLHPLQLEAYPDVESATRIEHGVESYQTHPLGLLLPMADEVAPLHLPRNGTMTGSSIACSTENHRTDATSSTKRPSFELYRLYGRTLHDEPA
eukprot:scaffold423_cov61-Cylindrotheca_fusiformis.AAC.2